MNQSKPIVCLAFILGFLLLNLQPLQAQDLNRSIDELVRAEIKDENGPGGVFMVAQKGKPIYSKAFGKANLELDVKLTPESIFQLGSMTKQFTSIAILILEEKGLLQTQDPVSKYVADFPNGQNITLHHLLTHTSGIRDFTKMKQLKEIAQKEMSAQMMVDFFKNEPVDFAPGEKFDYNNSGYVLLGHIIEVASGSSYEDFIQKNIFEKAGMSHSCYNSDRKIIPKRAYGYQKKETGYVNKTLINYSVPFASGALMSNLEDLLRWQKALNENQLLKAENSRKAFTKYKLNDGKEFTYGYGWHLREINGKTSREHGGSIFGYKSMAVYLPESDIYVVGLTNCDGLSPTQLVQNIAKLALESLSKR
ncbi:beta-lactamase family protein [Flavobacterium sp. CYK-4]|uniref:serine hydrolase domain-containing protein n=1 Tax=Flavobacterium lotistagni TaxID=2709660 RepID=UPI00140D9F7C|nr:serine hydrolase domain-containing protein [Flavobacterium lotistagni]NHM08232.1 beta-lactamase family protein [Flavobacterium lotistagni]